MPNATDIVTEVALLSDEECARVVADVHDLRRLWQRRAPATPFYTLGTASYLDAARFGVPAYMAKARLTNPLLRQRFDWLYARLADALSTQLGGPVEYDESLALPGFHVFLCRDHPLDDHASAAGEPATHAAATREVTLADAPPHVDAQWELVPGVPGHGPSADLPVTTSFTLAVRLPAAGGGLDVWDVHASEVRHLAPERAAALIGERTRSYLAYRPGWLAMHSGMFFHRIAATELALPHDERLTLQGHGVFTGAAWRLYW